MAERCSGLEEAHAVSPLMMTTKEWVEMEKTFGECIE